MVCIFIEELNRSYLFHCQKKYECFDSVEIEAGGSVWHGIVVEEEWAINFSGVAKITL